MARQRVNNLPEYLVGHPITVVEETTFDDGAMKIKLKCEKDNEIAYVNVSELYIPGSIYQKGVSFSRLIDALVLRCARDGRRMKFSKVYNENLIRRFEALGFVDVTPVGHHSRTFVTIDVPRVEDFQRRRRV